MKSIDILSKTDRTCWSRILLIINFLMPKLRIVLPLLAISAMILGMVVAWGGFGSKISVLTGYIIYFMAIVAPIYIDKYVNSEVFLTLPASSTEKNITLILLCYVCIPLIVFIPAEFAVIFLSSGINWNSGESLLSGGESTLLVLNHLSIFLFSASLCFMTVEISRSLRVTKGIIAGIIAPVLSGSIASVIILITGWYNGLDSIISSGDRMMISQGVLSAGLTSIKFTSPIFIILAIIFSWIGCRGITRRQI